MFRGDTFCLDEGQMWHPAPVEVVIPGCFHGVLVGGASQLPRPAGRVGDLSNRELVLVQLQEEGGSTLLHWGHSTAISIGLSLPPLPLLPSHLPTAGPELAVPTEVFPGTGLTIR